MTLRLGILLLALIGAVSCSPSPDPNLPHVAFADKFARTLAAERFDEAERMLSVELQPMLPTTTLQQKYREMIGPNHGPARHIKVIRTLDVWPDKRVTDQGWVYVAIDGDDFSEAVALIVTQAGPNLAIRSVEWGRP